MIYWSVMHTKRGAICSSPLGWENIVTGLGVHIILYTRFPTPYIFLETSQNKRSKYSKKCIQCNTFYFLLKYNTDLFFFKLRLCQKPCMLAFSSKQLDEIYTKRFHSGQSTRTRASLGSAPGGSTRGWSTRASSLWWGAYRVDEVDVAQETERMKATAKYFAWPSCVWLLLSFFLFPVRHPIHPLCADCTYLSELREYGIKEP